MADRERCDDESLKKCIQEAYGCTDEQLMDELNEIEKSLSDSDFPDVEDRIMSRLMKRIEETAPEEKEEETEEIEECFASKNSEEAERKEKKVVRFGRKKLLLAAVLAATFAGTLGVTAIGGKSYFFREREREASTVFNSGKNKSNTDDLESAYKMIEDKFGGKIYAFNYLPEGAKLNSLEFDETGKAIMKIEYNENYIYFVQWKSTAETSVIIEADKENLHSVKNNWIGKEIFYSENNLESNINEFEVQIIDSDNILWCFGKTDRAEFEKIIENIYFFH